MTAKKSPVRSKKSSPIRKTVKSLEKDLENPTKSVVMGFEGVAFLFLLGAIAAVVAWMVYVAKFNLDVYRKIDTDMVGTKTIDDQVDKGKFTLKDLLSIEQFTICYQAVVASILLYFAFKYHFAE